MSDYTTPPTQYSVEYIDQDAYDKLLARYGSPDAIDPADYWASRDFADLPTAREFRRQTGGILKERYDITAEPFNDGTPFVHYDWQERIVED